MEELKKRLTDANQEMELGPLTDPELWKDGARANKLTQRIRVLEQVVILKEVLDRGAEETKDQRH